MYVIFYYVDIPEKLRLYGQCVHMGSKGSSFESYL